jgi:tyrosyl-tRNA synthetase
MSTKPGISASVEEQLEVIRSGTVEIVPHDLLVQKLERSIRTQQPLVVKQGFDPTAPDIHLGHTVGLRKLRQFQDLGHQVIFLVGDFTGLIGDPAGRSATRPRISHDALMENASTYTRQAFKILDPGKTIVDYNSRWLAKLDFAAVLDLSATQTVAQMLERDDFSKRFHEGKPISLLEFVYPLAQGYDSVALKADIEIGGTDQTFNLLMARDIQRQYGQEPQVIITLPLLEGIDGVDKMSKSLGNFIGITEPPEEIFGKTMSIPDDLILKYFERVSSKTPQELGDISRRLRDPATNPSHLKRELARDLVTQFHNAEAARAAEERFNRIHVEKDRPEDVERVELDAEVGGVWIVRALTKTGLCDSSSEARRMIQQGAVRVDGERISDVEYRLAPAGQPYTVKVGKRRFIEILIRPAG